jgi:competence protein ComEC
MSGPRFQPARGHSSHPIRAISTLIAGVAAAERDRWALWLPVLFGGGIAGYFALPSEPPAGALLGATALMCAAVAVLQRVGRGGVALVLGILAAPSAGGSVASLHALEKAAPVLERSIAPQALSGVVVSVEPFADGARVRLERLRGERRWTPETTPHAVRVKLREGDVPEIGERIQLSARLSPPPRPSYPGAYDFSRAAWFQRLGGVGFALSDWRSVPRDAPPSGWERAAIELGRLRARVGERVRAALPGVPGDIAVALLTGDRSGVPEADLEALRASGLAHLLAISGLHIGMVAMISFVTVRLGLAARERWARDWPIKKIAAGVALVVAFAYMLLAGATVPTQRAFMMTGVVLIAVMIDRRAISLRLVAVAAFVVLCLDPHALVGPSFQLSFAAVIALVAVYESYRPEGRDGEAARGWGRRAVFYFAAVALTTVIAGAATSPFAVHHFGRMAHYSVIANLAAVPMVTFIVMPAELLGVLLMPLGLEAVPLMVAGHGIRGVLAIAHWVAGLPGAEGRFPPMTGWGFAALVLGGLWCAIWRRSWRFLGVPLVLAGLISPMTREAPVLILGASIDQAALVWDGALWVERPRRDRFAQRVWSEKTGLPIGGTWRDLAARADAPLRIGPLGAVFRRPPGPDTASLTVVFVTDPRVIAEDCRLASFARLPLHPHPTLCGDRPWVGPADLIRDGVHAIFADGDRVRAISVDSRRGDRPWVR